MGSLTPAEMVPLGYFIAHFAQRKNGALIFHSATYLKMLLSLFVKIIIFEWERLEPKSKQSNLELLSDWDSH